MAVVPLDLIRDDIYSYAGIIREYRKSLDFDHVADALRKLADQLDAHANITGRAPVQPSLQVPDGWQLVPKEIHPLDSEVNCSALNEALASPPPARRSCDEQDWYQAWWAALLTAAPTYKEKGRE